MHGGTHRTTLKYGVGGGVAGTTRIYPRGAGISRTTRIFGGVGGAATFFVEPDPPVRLLTPQLSNAARATMATIATAHGGMLRGRPAAAGKGGIAGPGGGFRRRRGLHAPRPILISTAQRNTRAAQRPWLVNDSTGTTTFFNSRTIRFMA